MSEDEKSESREMKPGRAGWVRVEPTVRPSPKQSPPERMARLVLSLLEWERMHMPTSSKGEHRSYRVKVKVEKLN